MIDYRLIKKKDGPLIIYTLKFTKKSMDFLIGEGAPYIRDFIPILLHGVRSVLGEESTVVRLNHEQELQLQDAASSQKLIGNSLDDTDYQIYRLIINGLMTFSPLGKEQIFAILKRSYELLRR